MSMIARIRELSTPPKDDHDRAVLLLCDQYEALLQQGEPGDFRWLIEAPGQRYLGTRTLGGEVSFHWTKDHNAALAFRSEAQADATMMAVRTLNGQSFGDPSLGLFGFETSLGNAKAVEHAWLSASPLPPAPGAETPFTNLVYSGWLIERDCADGIEYVHTFAEWTRDANNALRFHRKGDAEDTVQIFFDEVDGVRVTEHAWDDGNEPQRRASSSRQAALEEAKDSERAILLARVVGFAVGSAAAEEHAGLISEFERLGFVTRRKHYSKVGSWEAYALTDSGFDHLERIASRNLTQRCLRAHIFYLRNTTTPPAEGETK